MEADRVKAVQEVSAGTAGHRKKNSEGKKSWSIQFLDRLLSEARERERAEQREREQAGQKRAREDAADAGGRTGDTGGYDEDDCRIVRQGEGPVPADWDSFEISGEWRETVLTSEMYADIIDSLKRVGNWSASVLYKIAEAVLRDYYEGRLDESAVEELFLGCYQKCVEKNAKIAASKKRRQEILAALYEYFSRVNARKSVSCNEREGRRLVEECGLTWAGTTYYNSQYYYIHRKMRLLFRTACERIAAREGLARLSYGKIARETQFRGMGGLSFHGVFVWIQKKDNYPEEQYGMRDLKKKPLPQFVYLYRNHFAKCEESRIALLGQRMKQMHREIAEQLRCADGPAGNCVEAGGLARNGIAEARAGQRDPAGAATVRNDRHSPAGVATVHNGRHSPAGVATAHNGCWPADCDRSQTAAESASREPRQLWRSFTQEEGRDYHNGMSYLLEGSLMDDQDEAVYAEAMEFLRNFRLYRLAGCVEFLSVTD